MYRKLTLDLVQEALGRLEHGENEASVASRLKVSQSNVNLIKLAKTWRQVQPFVKPAFLQGAYNEEWRPWPTNKLYSVSDQGRVVGPAGNLLKIRILEERGGYVQVFIKRKPGEPKFLIYVHRLVLLETFAGLRPDGQQCRHLDGNPLNNFRSNLAWGTVAANREDMRCHGTMPRGEKHHQAKLTADDVKLIRSSTAKGSELARLFKVSQAAISLIRSGSTWK